MEARDFSHVRLHCPDKNILSANEVFLSQVLEEMNIPHAEYLPVHIGKEVVCVSPCFINTPDQDFVSALQISHQERKIGKNLYHWFCDHGYGKEVDTMIVVDALFANTDRHLNNFGILQNGQEYQFAPLFDHGSSLGWNGLSSNEVKPFCRYKQEQLALVSYIPELPDRKYCFDILQDTYEEFEIPEKNYVIAKKNLTDNFQYISQLNRTKRIAINNRKEDLEL